MLIAKTNPVGIDVNILKLQTFLHSSLIAKWVLGSITEQYKCYGRCYRNPDNGYIAENYIGEDKYEEVYFDSKLMAISFFGASTVTKNSIGQNTDVHLVFFVDLKKIKPSILHRADEEVRKDVNEIIGNGRYGFVFTSIETGIENVLKEYPGSRRDDRLKYVDMQPGHCFRLNFSLGYNINSIYCP